MTNTKKPQTQPLLSLCMIIRDAEDTIQALLDSVTAQAVFDEIVLVDTGSTDRTREIVSEHFDFEWPIKDPDVNEVDADGWLDHSTPVKVTLAHFKWVDDFAAARQFSFELATGRWRMYLDSDDILPEADAKQLRNAIRELEESCPQANALAMSYIYRDSQVVQPATVRAVRWDDGYYWTRPIHENLRCKTQRVIGKSKSHNFKVVHNKPDEGHEKSLLRNHAIAMKAYENAKTPQEKAEYAYFCSTYLKSVPEGMDRAIELLDECWAHYRGTNFGCYARFDLARIYLENKMYDQALTCASEIEGFSPEFREGLLLLGVIHNRRGDYGKSALFFDQVRQRPDYPFVNFDEYWFTEGLANAVAANTYCELGRFLDAEKALGRVPPKLTRFGPVIDDFNRAQRLVAQDAGLERLMNFVDYLQWSTEAPKAVRLLLSDLIPAPIAQRPEVQQKLREIRAKLPHYYGTWEDYKAAYASIPEDKYHTSAHDVQSVFAASRVEILMHWVEAQTKEGPPLRYASIGFQDGIMEERALETNPRLQLMVADVAPQASEGLKRLQEKFPGRVTFHSIEKGAFDWCPRGQEGTFDLVTLFEVIEHVPGDDGDVQALRVLRRMLVPETGTLLLSTPCADRWVESYLTAQNGPKWFGHVRAHNSGSLLALLDDLGLYGTLVEGWDGTFVAEVQYNPTMKFLRTPDGDKRNVAILVPSTPKPFDAFSHMRGFTGGSEEAVIYLAEALSKKGHRVTVYTPEFTPVDSNFIRAHQGVLWRDVKEFDFWGDSYETVLFWRCPQVVAQVVDAPYKKVLWLHDYEYTATPDQYECADTVVVLSKSHGDSIKECDGFEGPFHYGANGIDADLFPSVLGLERDPHKVVYMSSPDRGLHRLLEEWPKIREQVPTATLDIYYDWTQFAKIQPEFHALLTKQLEEFAAADDGKGLGVRHVGGVDQPTLHEAMRKASVWVYPNTGKIETFCCHPDTKIAIPGNHREGLPPTVRIADLEGKENVAVYTYSEEEKRFKIGTMTKCWKTKTATQMVHITLDDGEVLKLTPEHLVLTFDDEWVQAKDIQPNTRLMALHYRYDVMILDRNGNWTKEHRLVGEWKKGRPLGRSEQVDHIDVTRLDNSPHMLQILTASAHAAKTHGGKQIRKKQVADALVAMQKWREENHEEMRELLSAAGKRKWEKLRHMSVEEQQAYLKTRGKAGAEARKKREAEDPEFAEHMRAVRASNTGKAHATQKAKEARMTPEERAEYYAERGAKIWTSRKAKYGEQGRKNHVAVGVELVDEAVDVYDMEVEGTHTFIANGVVVHNCITAVKAQACGLTCITTDAGALGEVLLDGQIIAEGLIDSPMGREILVQKTVKALNNPEPDAVREVRRLKALEKFSWQKVAELFEEVL